MDHIGFALYIIAWVNKNYNEIEKVKPFGGIPAFATLLLPPYGGEGWIRTNEVFRREL